jgi:hypothetical protein
LRLPKIFLVRLLSIVCFLLSLHGHMAKRADFNTEPRPSRPNAAKAADLKPAAAICLQQLAFFAFQAA